MESRYKEKPQSIRAILLLLFDRVGGFDYMVNGITGPSMISSRFKWCIVPLKTHCSTTRIQFTIDKHFWKHWLRDYFSIPTPHLQFSNVKVLLMVSKKFVQSECHWLLRWPVAKWPTSFEMLCPVRFEVVVGASCSETLKEIREQLPERAPRKGGKAVRKKARRKSCWTCCAVSRKNCNIAFQGRSQFSIPIIRLLLLHLSWTMFATPAMDQLRSQSTSNPRWNA